METIFVAALKEETPKLSKFHHTGVGKINASIKLMELINKLNIISLLIKQKSLNKNLIQIKKVKFLYQAFFQEK